MKVYYSKKLGLEFIVNDSGGVKFSDGVVYTPEEVALMKDAQLPKVVHMSKRIFNGTVVK